MYFGIYLLFSCLLLLSLNFSSFRNFLTIMILIGNADLGGIFQLSTVRPRYLGPYSCLVEKSSRIENKLKLQILHELAARAKVGFV